MELRGLQFLVALAEAEHFGCAARATGVDVSTMSRRIGGLEDSFGVLLFERSRIGVKLTLAGIEVLPRAPARPISRWQ